MKVEMGVFIIKECILQKHLLRPMPEQLIRFQPALLIIRLSRYLFIMYYDRMGNELEYINRQWVKKVNK